MEISLPRSRIEFDELVRDFEKLKHYQLAVEGMEVTQAIQYYRAAAHLTDTADRGSDNTVRLVAGKPAWVRVYLWSLTGVFGVTGTLEVQRRQHGTFWSTVATLSPRPPALSTVPAVSGTNYTTMRAALNQTLNFVIPSNEMIGTLRLIARINAGSLRAEHTITLPVTLQQTLRLAGVMIDYDGPASNAPDAPNVQIAAPTLANLQATAATALTLFPVQSTAQFRVADTLQLTQHLQDTSFPTSGCGTAWDKLLGRIANARTADGNQPGWIYYGLLPTGVPMGPVGGCGGGGVAAGPTNNQGTLTHEAGHAAGLSHAPAGGAPNPDPNYPVYEPYAQAAIGEFGLNINNGMIASPQLFRDFMSYGGPAWISLYHYEKLLDNATLNPLTVGIDEPWWVYIVWEEYKKWPWVVEPDPPPWPPELPMFPPDYPLEQVISLIVSVERGTVAEVMHVARTKVRTHLNQVKRTQLVASLQGAEGDVLTQAPLLRMERQPTRCDGCDLGERGEPMSYLAQAFVPDVAPGSALEISDGEKVLWRREAPQRAVEINSFNARVARRDELSEVLLLDWSISGRVEELWARWSDDGENWRLLTTDLNGDGAELEPPMLPPGPVELQLVAHDGFFSTYSETVSVTLRERPPEVSILHPVSGHRYIAGQTLRLWGAASAGGDLAASSAQAAWLLGNNQIAEGLDAWTSLDSGEHVLTLNVTNVAGTASAEVKITVDSPRESDK